MTGVVSWPSCARRPQLQDAGREGPPGAPRLPPNAPTNIPSGHRTCRFTLDPNLGSPTGDRGVSQPITVAFSSIFDSRCNISKMGQGCETTGPVGVTGAVEFRHMLVFCFPRISVPHARLTVTRRGGHRRVEFGIWPAPTPPPTSIDHTVRSR